MIGTTIVPAVAFILLGLAIAAIVRMPKGARKRAHATAASAFTLTMVAAAATTIWLWGVGFDYLDTYRQPPAYLHPAMVVSAWTAVGAYAGLVITGALAFRVARRQTATS